MAQRSSNQDTYGTVSLSPTDDVVAGTYGSWTFTYTVGALGMDDGGILKIAIHQTSDWGRPQFDDPTADNYTTVSTSGDAEVTASFNPDGHKRPYRHAIKVKVVDGALKPGETMEITLGNKKEGSVGNRAQTFAETAFRFQVLVDPHKTGDFIKLAQEPSFDIVPGRMNSFTAVLPATAEKEESVNLSVRAEDYWGNVATEYSGSLTIEESDGIEAPTNIELENGTGHASLTFLHEGVHRLTICDPETGIEVISNPCNCRSNGLNLYWGDLHGQTRETVGHGTVTEYFDHLSERAFVDFGSHAANDFQITDEFWETLQATIKDYHQSGEFVTFSCYEWSATTGLGGDHNVYFRTDDAELHRSSKWLVAEGEDKSEGVRPIENLYEQFRGRDDVLIIPHQGGRPSTLDVLDPDLTPFIEINSVWGVFEWFGREAMERGYQVGFVGGSDDHCGRPGTAPPDDLPKHNVTGGLMAAYADGLDRESLWDAFCNRRVYATTGERILLDVEVTEAQMGGQITTDSPVTVSTTINGTAPIREIVLFRGTERVASESFTGTDAKYIELEWSGQRSPRRSRNKVIDWTGGVTLDSGKIVRAEEFGIPHPEEGIQHKSDTTVRWEAYTTGNYQGVRLDLDAPNDATLSVSTPPVSTSVPLDMLDNVRIDAEGVNAELTVSQIGEPAALDAKTSFVDEPDPGVYPYYIRVQQTDGAMAWSSPIFVTVE